VNLGFESLDTGWTFFARAPDSAKSRIIQHDCHSGSRCDSIAQWGSQDWALYNSSMMRSVIPGEVWTFSLWIQVDSIPGGLSLSFVEMDSSKKALSWGLSPAAVGERLPLGICGQTLVGKRGGLGHSHGQKNTQDDPIHHFTPFTPRRLTVSNFWSRFSPSMSLVYLSRSCPYRTDPSSQRIPAIFPACAPDPGRSSPWATSTASIWDTNASWMPPANAPTILVCHYWR
jgi:hypothetical protein